MAHLVTVHNGPNWGVMCGYFQKSELQNMLKNDILRFLNTDVHVKLKDFLEYASEVEIYDFIPSEHLTLDSFDRF